MDSFVCLCSIEWWTFKTIFYSSCDSRFTNTSKWACRGGTEIFAPMSSTWHVLTFRTGPIWFILFIEHNNQNTPDAAPVWLCSVLDLMCQLTGSASQHRHTGALWIRYDGFYLCRMLELWHVNLRKADCVGQEVLHGNNTKTHADFQKKTSEPDHI